MVDCLERLGFPLQVPDDPAEPANRTLDGAGGGGRIPKAGTPTQPLELFVENAGTAARFLTAAALPRPRQLPGERRAAHARAPAGGPDRCPARARLSHRQRPTTACPAVVHGTGPRPGAACRSASTESSQFASALLLSAGIGGWTVSVTGANEDELPYVDMTRRLVRRLSAGPAASTTSSPMRRAPATSGAPTGCCATAAAASPGAHVPQWHAGRPEVSRPRSSEGRGARLFARDRPRRQHHDGDRAGRPLRRPRRGSPISGACASQECERVEALRTELTKCGAQVDETRRHADGHPGAAARGRDRDLRRPPHRHVLRHAGRCAVPGMRLRDPACVRKTFPNFFAKLAELGAGIRDARAAPRLVGSAICLPEQGGRRDGS